MLQHHVHPEQGEFWDNEGTYKRQFILQEAKAMVTSLPKDVKEGEQHGSVRI